MDEGRGRRVRAGGDKPLDGRALADLMRAVLAKGRPFRFTARGASMSPAIRDGDVVTVAPLSDREPRPGDVAAFVHPGTGAVRIHRIVEVSDRGFRLKGDAAFFDDGTAGRDRILGLVVRVERDGRTVGPGSRTAAALLARLSAANLTSRAARRLSRTFGRRSGRA